MPPIFSSATTTTYHKQFDAIQNINHISIWYAKPISIVYWFFDGKIKFMKFINFMGKKGWSSSKKCH
jgi:hypothetical protein